MRWAIPYLPVIFTLFLLSDFSVDELEHSGVENCAWTQRQQKILEKAMQAFPRGLDDRWDKIADAVPGKTKVK